MPTFSTLDEFKDWWLRNRKLRPPVDAVKSYPNINSVVLYRKGQFQVQMIVSGPGALAVEHSHPNVSSYELAMAGEGDITINGKTWNTRNSKEEVYITANMPHSGTAGPCGGIFLSIQKWADGVTPTCVGMDSPNSNTAHEWCVKTHEKDVQNEH